mmetsp:Transcript_33679/g.71324  ORF Transcript_33679/g.71324 Transcript_33679/m.71324 type:complete len:238 (+) Transcript_33679:1342-2055(+)
MSVLRVRFLLLQLTALILKLVLELLQHVDDAPRVRLISVGLRRTHVQPNIFRCLSCRQKRVQYPPRVGRNQILLHLQKHACRLLTIVCLLLNDCDRSCQRVDRLGVVLVRRLVVVVLHLPHSSGRLQVPLIHADVLIQLSNLLGSFLNSRLAFPDQCLQRFNLLTGFLDGTGLLHRRIVAELLVSSKLDLLLVLLLLALLQHAVHQLDHLLHRSDLRSRSRNHSREKARHTHCADQI